jgi:hypothetical protein
LKFLSDFIKNSSKLKNVINKYGYKLVLFHCSSLSFRLLKEPKYKREKEVTQFIFECKEITDVLLKNGKNFKPYNSVKIILAILIDKSYFLSAVYVFYRKIKYKN